MGLKRFFCLFAALLVIIIAVKSEPSLQTLHQWSQLTYDQDYDNFKPENNILGNVRSYKSNLYVSVPRWRDGVPSTLNVLQENGKLRPFPNLDLNQVGPCQNLQNVASLEVVGSILWVVDSGTSAIFSRPNKQCSAKLIRMDLEKAEMRIFHVFSREMVPENSVILQLVVDQGKFYMANAIQGSILVFDSRAKRSQLVKSEFMAPKNHPISLSNGQMTYLRLGVTSLTLQNIGKVRL